jgi:L-amino acid N-acyltransferase YncA
MRRKIIIKTNKEAQVPVEALYSLFQESFRQWSDNGIDSPFLHKTLEEFDRVIERSAVFVALDADNGELVGMHCFAKYRSRYVFDYFLAVAPQMQEQGIATQLLQEEVTYLQQRGCRYMKCTTSAAAPWSVQWHLKNGYYVVGYSRSEKQNYASYIFRKQIAPSLLWSRPLAPITAKLLYCLSWLATNICKSKSGKLNWIGRMAKRWKKADV